MIVCTENKKMRQYDIFGGISEIECEMRLRTPTMQSGLAKQTEKLAKPANIVRSIE